MNRLCLASILLKECSLPNLTIHDSMFRTEELLIICVNGTLVPFPRCYLCLGDWRTELQGDSSLDFSTISSILNYYQLATEYDHSWYKAWHAWAYMNFQALLQHKQDSRLLLQAKAEVRDRQAAMLVCECLTGVYFTVLLGRGANWGL